METIRSKEVLRKLLLGNEDATGHEHQMLGETRDKMWDSFSREEQEVIRTHYYIGYEVHVYFKQGDDAGDSLTEWAEMIEDAAKTIRALANLGLEIDQADTHSVTLKGPAEKLEEAARAGWASRDFHLEEERAVGA